VPAAVAGFVSFAVKPVALVFIPAWRGAGRKVATERGELGEIGMALLHAGTIADDDEQRLAFTNKRENASISSNNEHQALWNTEHQPQNHCSRTCPHDTSVLLILPGGLDRPKPSLTARQPLLSMKTPEGKRQMYKHDRTD
jgi:hypothetical protein